jgi:CRISPR system Cascade subunit CasD
MREFLVFQLYGMMASWGDIAVGEDRPTYDRPSKSGVIGLIAASLGIRRDEEERLRELTEGYKIAVAIESEGVLVQDYHTAQVLPSGSGRKKEQFSTRQEELAGPNEELNTILSTRDYWCDARYSVFLWCNDEHPPYPLDTLMKKLKEPIFTLYLGRKACPLYLPLDPRIIQAENLRVAIASAMTQKNSFLSAFRNNPTIRVFWEGNEASGIIAEHTITRRDYPLSKKRWQFSDRIEHYAMLDLKTGA